MTGAPAAGPSRSRPRPAGPAVADPAHPDRRHSAATVTVDPDDPLLTGHYPGFPIYPGVCLVDQVHRTVLATDPGPARDLRLAEVVTVRFVRPVFPGDELDVHVDWRPEPGGWLCAGTVGGAAGPAATVKLRYRTGTPEVAA